MTKQKIGGLLNNCEALLFDKDGTLIDFNHLWLNWSLKVAGYISEKFEDLPVKEFLAQWGVDSESQTVDSEGPLAVGSMEDLIGAGAGLIYRCSGLWPESRQIVCDAMAAGYSSTGKDQYSRAIKGIPGMIRRLKKEGYKLAVVTTDETESARSDLEIIGLADCFNVVLGCDQVENCKPFPDLALKACEMMNVLPKKAAVIGDTRADMLMGRQAGVAYCVGVTSGVGTIDKLSEYADIVLGSAADLLIM